MQGKDKLSIQIDSETRAAFNWLKENNYNASGLIKQLLRSKVAELKLQQEESK